MKYCGKCGTQTSKRSDVCNVCGSLDFCLTQKSHKIYYIGSTEVTPEQIKSIEDLIALNQKIEAIKMVRDITGLALSMAKKYVENHCPIDKFCSQSIEVNDSDLEDIPMPKLSHCICWCISSLLSIVSFIFCLLGDLNLLSLLFFLFIIICIVCTRESILNYSLSQKDFDSYRRQMQSIKAAEKRQQEAENCRQQEIQHKRAEYSKKGIPTCPKCGSPSIKTINRGYSIVWGFIGSGKPVNVCQNCGHKWEPGK